MWLICSTTEMPKEERVKWGEDCISCVTAKEINAHVSTAPVPALLLGAEMWAGACFLHWLALCPSPLQWQPPKFSGSGASLGSRTAKRGWENPSNTALIISTCTRQLQPKDTARICCRASEVSPWLKCCHCFPAQGLKGEVIALRKQTLRKWGREQNQKSKHTVTLPLENLSWADPVLNSQTSPKDEEVPNAEVNFTLSRKCSRCSCLAGSFYHFQALYYTLFCMKHAFGKPRKTWFNKHQIRGNASLTSFKNVTKTHSISGHCKISFSTCYKAAALNMAVLQQGKCNWLNGQTNWGWIDTPYRRLLLLFNGTLWSQGNTSLK